MEKGWEERYYINQAGNGFAPYVGLRYQRGNGFNAYSGLRYQKGNGFMGRIWKGVTLPLLKYIGQHGLEAAGNIVHDIAHDPDNIREIVKKEARKLAGKAIEDGGKRVSKFIQSGEGVSDTQPDMKSYKRRNPKVSGNKSYVTIRKPKSQNKSFLRIK